MAIILSGIVLKYVGFDAGNPTQTVETMTQLRIADIIIPAGTAALAIVVMLKYDISDERAHLIKEKLIERRGEI